MKYASPPAVFIYSSVIFCTKSQLCGRKQGHPGKYNNERSRDLQFWESSPFYKMKEGQDELSRKSCNVDLKEAKVQESLENLAKQQDDLDTYERSVQERVDAASVVNTSSYLYFIVVSIYLSAINAYILRASARETLYIYSALACG